MSSPTTPSGKRFIENARAAVLDPSVAHLLGADGRQQLVALISIVALEDAIFQAEAEAFAAGQAAQVVTLPETPRRPEPWPLDVDRLTAAMVRAVVHEGFHGDFKSIREHAEFVANEYSDPHSRTSLILADKHDPNPDPVREGIASAIRDLIADAEKEVDRG